eukprot:3296848-Lingulodinium_polyedra.AAC.1
MASAPSVSQQTYAGLCVFKPPPPAPVSTTVDVAFEQYKHEVWRNIPLRARLNVQAFFDDAP